MVENSIPSITDLLFVYGTLRRGYANQYAIELHQHSTYQGIGWFPGRLYKVGWFPGALYDPAAPTRVWGEVYQLHHPEPILTRLDVYEGVADDPPLFVRQTLPISRDNQLLTCHTYLYALPTDTLPLINAGKF